MGITRDSVLKRRATGGKQKSIHKKRKFLLARPSASTKIGEKRIHTVRVRGGNYKYRALRLNSGNFSWGSEHCTRKTRILDVVYNASNNELVRTKTLVKNAVITVDATPFRQWYMQHYNVELGKKKETTGEETRSAHVTRKIEERGKDRVLPASIAEQFQTGRLYACIASRPGQSGRADGYILEGPELDFYLRQIKKKKGAAK
eukprot:TRINITY_DN1381_c0_g1::TRINITY_DN1381_c0_g1_i1::g.20030::m.20030 TRINITY_DN1381_c0_g1::TRINITY_DN1381_c0_g1_i1::g.20030  ORF type:complete len:217 (+),score=71.15,sp/P62243/RS8_RAT/64.73/5e-88,Ribosomal_S8e/PF01201.17/1.1e-48 TRINITY_DN1381_c0_g1_i1:44-652(+)